MSQDFDLVAELHDHPLAYGIPEMAAPRGPPARPAPHEPLSARRGVRPPPAPPPCRPTCATTWRWCLGELTAQGFDVIVVDQTLPEQRRLGLATVNVIVPGLVPDRLRLGPPAGPAPSQGAHRAARGRTASTTT